LSGISKRREFSVIGDAVNTAARVEAATRQTGDTVLIAQRTRNLLRSEPIGLEERTGAALKGKREAVRLYAAVTAPERLARTPH
jgi:adenylate cyclase